MYRKKILLWIIHLLYTMIRKNRISETKTLQPLRDLLLPSSHMYLERLDTAICWCLLLPKSCWSCSFWARACSSKSSRRKLMIEVCGLLCVRVWWRGINADVRSNEKELRRKERDKIGLWVEPNLAETGYVATYREVVSGILGIILV